MEIETEEKNGFTLIKIYTEEKAALVVKSGREERIYLPASSGSDSGYYVEKTGQLVETGYGYAVKHSGPVDHLEIIN